VIVVDDVQAICIYRHNDSYPDGDEGVIAAMSNASKYAWEFPRFEAGDFSAAIIRSWKNCGGRIFIDGSVPLNDLFAMVHDDCAWVYVVDGCQTVIDKEGKPRVRIYQKRKLVCELAWDEPYQISL
jgi:hypothetical protein